MLVSDEALVPAPVFVLVKLSRRRCLCFVPVLAVYHSFLCFRSTEAGVAFALYNLFFNDLLPIKDRSLFFFGVLRPIGPVKEGVFTESKGGDAIGPGSLAQLLLGNFYR